MSSFRISFQNEIHNTIRPISIVELHMHRTQCKLEGTQRLHTSGSGLLGGVRETSHPCLQGSSVTEIASSPRLYYAKINVHVSLSLTALFYINNGTDMSIVFCEFSLLVNIKYLHNIRDNKLNQAFLTYFCYTEKPTEFYEIFNQFSTMIHPKFIRVVRKIGAILFEIS